MEKALADGGVVLIPAFSIGRTQELLYEIESIIHDHAEQTVSHTATKQALSWQDIDIIIDFPFSEPIHGSLSGFKALLGQRSH